MHRVTRAVFKSGFELSDGLICISWIELNRRTAAVAKSEQIDCIQYIVENILQNILLKIYCTLYCISGVGLISRF